jgi:hypothetical protein
MKLKVILVCTLLLLAAVPSFAAPQCMDCNYWNECEVGDWSIERCRYDDLGNCYTTFEFCITSSPQTTVLTEWKVASIEISRPSLDAITVTAPVQVAEVRTATPHPTE